MAASAWQFYNEAKGKMGSAEWTFASNGFRMALFLSNSNATTRTLSLYSELTNEVASANNYTQGGKLLSGNTWATGASAGEYRFDTTAKIWTASGGNISGIKYAVIYKSASAGGGPLLLASTLTSSPFSISDTNTLTVTPNTYVFSLA